MPQSETAICESPAHQGQLSWSCSRQCQGDLWQLRGVMKSTNNISYQYLRHSLLAHPVNYRSEHKAENSKKGLELLDSSLLITKSNKCYTLQLHYYRGCSEHLKEDICFPTLLSFSYRRLKGFANWFPSERNTLHRMWGSHQAIPDLSLRKPPQRQP